MSEQSFNTKHTKTSKWTYTTENTGSKCDTFILPWDLLPINHKLIAFSQLLLSSLLHHFPGTHKHNVATRSTLTHAFHTAPQKNHMYIFSETLINRSSFLECPLKCTFKCLCSSLSKQMSGGITMWAMLYGLADIILANYASFGVISVLTPLHPHQPPKQKLQKQVVDNWQMKNSCEMCDQTTQTL